MNRYIGFLFSLFLFIPLIGSETHSLPISYQGRIRPAEAYARLWLYDFYHSQSVKKEHWEAFNQHSPSALALIWQIHFLGHEPFIHTPLFFISSTAAKQMAGLPLSQNYFSYQELYQAFYENKESNANLAKALILHHASKAFSSHGQPRTIELSNLTPGLWVKQHQARFIITMIPESSFWKAFQPGQSISNRLEENQNTRTIEEISHLIFALQQFKTFQGGHLKLEQEFQHAFESLKTQQLAPQQIQQSLEKDFPLIERLRHAGFILKALPSRYHVGEWFSLHALKCLVYHPTSHSLKPVDNFTLFSDEEFERIRQLYFKLEKSFLNETSFLDLNEFSTSLNTAYEHLAGKLYQKAYGKSLSYPSMSQLCWESLYYQYPLFGITILLYGLAVLFIGFNYRHPSWTLNKGASLFLGMAFALHSSILILRCYILGRPPVANMFETLVYVPWIAVGAGLVLNYIWPGFAILLASALASLILLILSELTSTTSSLENIQPVLDSQFWLIIHVLMVVGSYGVFFLCSLLGHFYLITFSQKRQETASTRHLASCILQSMYLGTALLIIGTILGGIWAAESWGRFWDWDPKEAWAFISSCVYLIWIHSYRFNKISQFGLAMGSIIGFLFISFTWYGVNYILGTGLHSYGFGIGGEGYYYLFLITETFFIAYMGYPYSKMSQSSLP